MGSSRSNTATQGNSAGNGRGSPRHDRRASRLPVIPPSTITRPRLLSLLDLAASQRLTLVVAPPGYGKTVLLAQWATARRRERIRWLTLTPAANNPARLQKALRDALPLSTSPGMRATSLDIVPAARWAAPLVTSVDDSAPTTLIIDDLHVLTSTEALNDLATFIGNAPRWFRFIIASQVDPPMYFLRLRWSDAIVELRQEDLAFSSDEASELVRAVVGMSVSSSQIDAMVRKTEGWPFGLHLAALSLRDQPDVDGFVQTFAENDRHVADYLTQNVLDRQSDEVREFLVETSVLQRISGSLCDAVTGRDDSAAMLEMLERSSTFVMRVDEPQRWFRYHDLLRSLLRRRLHEDRPGAEAALLHRAANWHIERGDLDAGVDYLIEARAWHDLVAAVLLHGTDSNEVDRASSIVRWLDAVPPEVMRSRVDAQLTHAAAMVFGGPWWRASATLDQIDGNATTPVVAVVTDLLRAHLSLHEGAPDDALAFAARVHEGIGRIEDGRVPNVLGLITGTGDLVVAAQLAEGLAHLFRGEFDDARWALSPVIDGTHASWSIVSLGALALLECWSGRLTMAEDLARQALTLGSSVGDNGASTTIAHIALVYTACERDELDAAMTTLAQVTPHLEGERRGVMAVLVDLGKAEVALAEGNAEQALHRLASRRVFDDGSVWLLAARRRAVEARAWMAMGDLEHAHEVLGAPCAEDGVDRLAVRAQLAIERSDIGLARELVARWPDGPEPRASLLRIMWLALVAQREGNEDSALALWSTVVGAAATEWNFGLFRSAGDPALSLSRTFYRSTPTPFVRAVIERLSARAPTRPRSTKSLIEQLTEREHTVLAMLSTHFSSTEIAERLGISRNTLKTHLKHIYRKLGVEGRSEAVAKAERLHLL